MLLDESVCCQGRADGQDLCGARKLVSLGTVIYSTVRPYLLNIAIIDRTFEHEPIASTAFGIIHPFKGISSRFVFYWLRSAPFISYVQGEMKGMAYPAINDEKFYNGYVPIPPSTEQNRIGPFSSHFPFSHSLPLRLSRSSVLAYYPTGSRFRVRARRTRPKPSASTGISSNVPNLSATKKFLRARQARA